MRREKKKEEVLRPLIDETLIRIRSMEEGAQASIAQIVGDIYSSSGYEFMHGGPTLGYVWTKDHGETYAIRDFDQFDILSRVEKQLKGEIKLDFSAYENLVVGLPYNLEFVIRKVK